VDKIKSALEKALERAEELSPPTNEERLEWKWLPEGKRLAGLFIESKAELPNELHNFDQSAHRYLVKGIVEVLVEMLRLPENPLILKTNERALDGLSKLIGDIFANMAERTRYVWNQYLQFYPSQIDAASQHLKLEVQSQLEEAVRQKTGTQGPINLGPIEAQPEFQAQLMKLGAQMKEPYENHLRDFRIEIRGLV
jgi:hypothetical protein